MMHVAQAGEDRGRVVLHLGSSTSSPMAIEVAIDAAIWLARAFQSEIESLFVENEQLIALAGHPSARATSVSGRVSGAVSLAEIEQHLRFASTAFHEQTGARARAVEVPCRRRVVRGDAVRELALACAERGPWNVVALAEPFTSPDCPSPRQLFDGVIGTTGLLLVGPRARPSKRAAGGDAPRPIVLALEDIDRLPVLLAVAERLTKVQKATTIVCLVASDATMLAELEAQTRLLLAERNRGDGSSGKTSDIEIMPAMAPRGSPGCVAEILRRLAPGLTVGQFGGLLLPEDGDLRPLAQILECPLLLVR